MFWYFFCKVIFLLSVPIYNECLAIRTSQYNELKWNMKIGRIVYNLNHKHPLTHRQPMSAVRNHILSWLWLNIWFEPMRWLIWDHVTGILAFFRKLPLLCLTQVLKVMLKMHIYALDNDTGWIHWNETKQYTKSANHIYIYICIYIYTYNCWKSPNSSHMYDHGFMDNTNRQAVCKSQKII